MPDSSDTHEADIDLIPGTAESDIVALLYNNLDTRFSGGDIQDRLVMPRGTVTTTLTRLNNDGLTEKTEDGYYHALGHREDLRRYVASVQQTKRLFENMSKDYEEHTDIESPIEDDDEDELDAEIAELEADLNKE
jgi:DNA-binding MarR family transcriptional regulator